MGLGLALPGDSPPLKGMFVNQTNEKQDLHIVAEAVQDTDNKMK